MATNRSDGLETRNKLLAAAGEVFAEKGYHDTKTAEICQRASANIAAVNYHFRSKENLYVEAWRHAFERSIRIYPPDGGVPSGAPAEERLRGQIRAQISRAMDPVSIDFDIANREMANPTGLLAEVMHRVIEPLHQSFNEIVRELLGGEVPEKTVQMCEMSIHSQCMAQMFHSRHRKPFVSGEKIPRPRIPVFSIDELVDHIICFSLSGIEGVRQAISLQSEKSPGLYKRKK